MKLNFDGMMPEQIETFIKCVEIHVEVDASEKMIVSEDGEISYGELESSTATGWLNCSLFGIDINNNVGENQEDIVEFCLQAYKDNYFDFNLTSDAIHKKYGVYA